MSDETKRGATIVDVGAILAEHDERERREVRQRSKVPPTPSPYATALALGDEVDQLRTDLDEARAEVERWKSASGLIDGSGDPDGVTPEAMRRYWEQVEAERDEARAEVKRLRETLDELAGASAALLDGLEESIGECVPAYVDAVEAAIDRHRARQDGDGS
mgnify:CR=1 FL=1